MYYNKCCVPGCKSLRQDVILHKFPNSEQRLNKWMEYLACASIRIASDNLDQLLICHKHFEARFVTPRSRLLSRAYPTLFSAQEISSGVPSRNILQQNSENLDPNIDHSYAVKSLCDHNYSKAPLPAVLSHQKKTSKVQTDQVPSTSQCVPFTQGHSLAQEMEEIRGLVAPTKPKVIVHAQRSARKKLVLKVDALSTTSKRLYMEYRKIKKTLSFTRRAKRSLEISKKLSFEKAVSNMNPLARQILWMQIKLCTKKQKARRFTLDEKLIALAILKQSPKCYKFLKQIFILPSETTLKKVITKLNIGPGINSQIISLIKGEVSSWTENKKYCSIIFDEMALETGLTYTNNDTIDGFVDHIQRENNFADHALVFMVKGAIYNWKQTIAYYFCEGATKGPQLQIIIKEIVKAVGQAGLIPVALVSDQGTAFQSCLRSLQRETRRDQILSNTVTDDTIKINGFTLNIIYDPPHLIKGIRNNFLTKDIDFDGKRARWSDIVDVYMTDCQHAETRLLHKLNDEHVIPDKIKKMKVKNCVRVFSNTMAGALLYTSSFSYYVNGKPVSSTLKNTAEVVSFLDKLFDSVNGSHTQGKGLRRALTVSSKHHEFWKDV